MYGSSESELEALQTIEKFSTPCTIALFKISFFHSDSFNAEFKLYLSPSKKGLNHIKNRSKTENHNWKGKTPHSRKVNLMWHS